MTASRADSQRPVEWPCRCDAAWAEHPLKGGGGHGSGFGGLRLSDG